MHCPIAARSAAVINRLSLCTALLSAGLFFSCGQFSAPDSPDTAPGSTYPNICQTDDGFVMIWYEGDQHIVISEFTAEGWSRKDTIVSSERFFKNWADLPQVYHAGGNTFALSWLEMSGEGTYDYDVHVSISTDRGTTLSEPVIPHRDGVKGEHGFVSFFDFMGSTGLIWLDGRAMMPGGHGHGSGSMRLYASTIDPTGELGLEIMLDDMVCECCPTAAVNTSAGPLVAFRDRDPDETRNIQLSFINGAQLPRPIHDDGWVVPGCPVNGPAMRANGENVAIAWYTAPDNAPQVNISFSHDGGMSFGAPIRIDDGKAIGRPDLVWLDDETVLVSWLEEGVESGKLVLKKASASGSAKLLSEFDISSGRGSGYPKLALVDDHVFVAWTEPGEVGRIQSEWISYNE
jgi:hypothetical protein